MVSRLRASIRALQRSTAEVVTTAGDRLLRSHRLMRAPIWIYRAHLGFLFGTRLVMLEHIGRRSGERRRVVLEVIGRPDRDTYVVASGFGTRSQWFRNVRADPRVRVSVGRSSRAQATATVLSAEEASAVIADYRSRHPHAWAAFKHVLESTLGSPVDDDATTLPMVAFHIGR